MKKHWETLEHETYQVKAAPIYFFGRYVSVDGLVSAG